MLNSVPDLTKSKHYIFGEEGEFRGPDGGPKRQFVTHQIFAPYLTAIPVREGTESKEGAVVLLLSRGLSGTGQLTDTLPTAAHLRELGYQTFIVDYRLRPLCPGRRRLKMSPRLAVHPQKRQGLWYRSDDVAVMELFRWGDPGWGIFFSIMMRTSFPQPWTRTMSRMNWMRFPPMLPPRA